MSWLLLHFKALSCVRPASLLVTQRSPLLGRPLSLGTKVVPRKWKAARQRMQSECHFCFFCLAFFHFLGWTPNLGIPRTLFSSREVASGSSANALLAVGLVTHNLCREVQGATRAYQGCCHIYTHRVVRSLEPQPNPEHLLECSSTACFLSTQGTTACLHLCICAAVL